MSGDPPDGAVRHVARSYVCIASKQSTARHNNFRFGAGKRASLANACGPGISAEAVRKLSARFRIAAQSENFCDFSGSESRQGSKFDGRARRSIRLACSELRPPIRHCCEELLSVPARGGLSVIAW